MEKYVGTKIKFDDRVTCVDERIKSKTGVVVGCDKDIGITIVDSISGFPLWCLRGPSTWKRFNIPDDEETRWLYNISFDYLIKCINKNYMSYYDFVEYDKLTEQTTTYEKPVDTDSCGFY